MKIVSVLAGTPVCISDNVRLTARRITRQRQAMKPDRREGFSWAAMVAFIHMLAGGERQRAEG